jgi:hypothetical protein
MVVISGHKAFAQEQIVAELLSQGPGARGIIEFRRVAKPGHFVNAENIGGKIWFYDTPNGWAFSADNPNAFLGVCDSAGPFAIRNEGGIRLILTNRAPK